MSAHVAITKATRSDTSLYVWEDPSKSIRIEISLELVDRLGAALREAPHAGRTPEVGGILLGETEPGDEGSIVIWDVAPVKSEYRRGTSYSLSPKDRKVLHTTLAEKRNLSVVGYYRTHTRPGLYLDKDDFSVMSTYFRAPSQVALLVKPCAQDSVAGFFFWEDGDIHRKSSYRQFPFVRRQLLDGDFPIVSRPDRFAGGESFASSKEAGESACPTRLPVLRALAPRSAGTAISIGLVMLAGVFSLYGKLSHKPVPAIELNVQRAGPELRLQWNPNSPVIEQAGLGVLSIFDGDRREQLELSAKQLASGSVTYSPTTSDVNFQMDIFFVSDGVSGSVHAFSRVLPEPLQTAW